MKCFRTDINELEFRKPYTFSSFKDISTYFQISDGLTMSHIFVIMLFIKTHLSVLY